MEWQRSRFGISANASTTYDFRVLWHRGCFVTGVPDRSGDAPHSAHYMKQSTDTTRDEPVGIVISGGHPSSEAATRFSAYIWAPAPEEESTEEVQAA